MALHPYFVANSLEFNDGSILFFVTNNFPRKHFFRKSSGDFFVQLRGYDSIQHPLFLPSLIFF